MMLIKAIKTKPNLGMLMIFFLAFGFLSRCTKYREERQVRKTEKFKVIQTNPEFLSNKIQQKIKTLQKQLSSEVDKTKKDALKVVINVLNNKNTFLFKMQETEKYCGGYWNDVNEKAAWAPVLGSNQYYPWRNKQINNLLVSLEKALILKSRVRKKTTASGHASSLLLLGGASFDFKSLEDSQVGVKILTKYIKHDLIISGIMAEINSWRM